MRRGQITWFVSVFLCSFASIAGSETKSDKWNEMFHKGSPAPAATAAASPAAVKPVTADSVQGTQLLNDVSHNVTYFAKPAQINRLASWQPDRADPPVPFAEIARRAKEYAEKSSPLHGWLISGFHLLPIAAANGTKWYYWIVIDRPWELPDAEAQTYMSHSDIPPNSHFNRTTDAQTRFVLILQDGTLIEPIPVTPPAATAVDAN